MLTLMYHNILTQPANDLPIARHQVTLRSFERHVQRLRPQVLHPFEAHALLFKTQRPEGIVLTFDDGAMGLLEAAQVLARYGCVGVAFVCPGALRNGLWFYRLADSLARTHSTAVEWSGQKWRLGSPKQRAQAYHAISTKLSFSSTNERDENLHQVLELLKVPEGDPHPSLTIMNEGVLRKMVQTGGMVLANHSWSHPNLAKLSYGEYHTEIDSAQQWLENSGLPFVPWFAFPHGAHDAATRQAVGSSRLRAFGAGMVEPMGVLPRAGVYGLDASSWRFRAKTVVNGQLVRLKQTTRKYWRRTES